VRSFKSKEESTLKILKKRKSHKRGRFNKKRTTLNPIVVYRSYQVKIASKIDIKRFIGDGLGFLQEQTDDFAFDFNNLNRIVNSIAQE